MVIYTNTTDISKPSTDNTVFYLILLAMHINIVCGIVTYSEVRKLNERFTHMEKSMFDAGKVMYSLTYQMKTLLHDIMNILGTSTGEKKLTLEYDIDV